MRIRRKGAAHAVGLMCRRDTSPRTLCERCESCVQSISRSVDEKEAEDQRPIFGRVSYIDLQVGGVWGGEGQQLKPKKIDVVSEKPVFVWDVLGG